MQRQAVPGPPFLENRVVSGHVFRRAARCRHATWALAPGNRRLPGAKGLVIKIAAVRHDESSCPDTKQSRATQSIRLSIRLLKALGESAPIALACISAPAPIVRAPPRRRRHPQPISAARKQTAALRCCPSRWRHFGAGRCTSRA